MASGILSVQCLALLALLVFQHRSHQAERLTWNSERNALLERLVPGSTPVEETPPRTFLLGNDHAEYLASLDPETRAQLEREVIER